MSKRASKRDGWFSRRHQTNEAHLAAQAAKAAKLQAQQDATETRILAASQRTPLQQIARLDARLGPGVGAKKERARLLVKVEEYYV